jgi:ribosomal protein L11 methyltransferase
VAEAKWFEVSLRVDGELAEAVAEVLNRFASGGVVMENGITHLNDEDEGTPEGPVRVSAYLAVDNRLEENRSRLEEALWHLGQIHPLPAPKFTAIEDQDWMLAWKVNYRPIIVGNRLLILPAWLENPDPERLVIKIDPGMAFGTGTHPSTQLCLEHLEEVIRPGKWMMDVGCGSGILSIGAIKLGASHALAVDIDSLSITNTRQNAEANGVLEFIEARQGSVVEIHRGDYTISQAPVVVANILAPVILRLFQAGLTDLVEPSGVLILAGILEEQLESIHDAARALGLALIKTRKQLDWVSPIYRK